ncbi:SDR family oxidoreductase [Aestuariimicrobium ganziense]|uniref:SDR family oxidoreductase n=1 Tax=Aestuariimicrobium ganziense TaxID=2773677 RepID=UPI0019441D2E|nr:SDR family oxidoreductase [Aestuariimicrobium ganziense]
MDLGLHDRCFLVTAASSGLGLASARALVAEGARVVMVARRADLLEREAAALGDGALALPGDLTDPDLPARAVRTAIDRFGRLDGALVSVGGPPPGTVLETTEEQWRAGFDSVFLPALRVARAVCPAVEAPRLGFVLSSSARTPLPRMAISNGLRPGLAGLVSQLADEIGPQGGRAVGVLPGSIATDRITDLHSGAPDPAAARAAAEQTIPLRRLGDPDEFGRVAAFLLSDAASYVSGTLVAVDGGAGRAI